MGIGPLQIAGVDYGSKFAGTTAIAWLADGGIHLAQSVKKGDADAWLMDQLLTLHVKIMFIDAPLSLPSVYSNPDRADGDDYFYRAADRAAGAMSPMFIGGLTARAMRLTEALLPMESVEVYPKLLAQEMNLTDIGYKQKDGDLKACCDRIEEALNVPFEGVPDNWHALDAVLALYTGIRWLDGRAKRFGELEEGLIWF